MEKIYACIDLKSFYASVEAVERKLDPFVAKLVVADESRGSGAITLAITPAMKQLGIKNRCRLYEIPKDIEYIIAKPRMKLYMEVSSRIYSIYTQFFSPQDIHIYSIDECFIDLSCYEKVYKMKAVDICKMVAREVLRLTGITASVGMGKNLFTAKLALDICAKNSKDYLYFLDEAGFDKLIAHHRPITDIWGIGKGIAKRLEQISVYDLADLQKIDESILFNIFGINARILIDHARGIEPCTMSDIKSYQSKSKSLSNSQILFEDYSFEDAFFILLEMLEQLSIDLMASGLKANNISLRIGYSKVFQKSSCASKKTFTPLQSLCRAKRRF